jgi:hypothetical protein
MDGPCSRPPARMPVGKTHRFSLLPSTSVKLANLAGCKWTWTTAGWISPLCDDLQTHLLREQGVGSSNLPAPTNVFNKLGFQLSTQRRETAEIRGLINSAGLEGYFGDCTQQLSKQSAERGDREFRHTWWADEPLRRSALSRRERQTARSIRRAHGAQHRRSRRERIRSARFEGIDSGAERVRCSPRARPLYM